MANDSSSAAASERLAIRCNEMFGLNRTVPKSANPHRDHESNQDHYAEAYRDTDNTALPTPEAIPRFSELR